MQYKYRDNKNYVLVLITSESCNLNCKYCDMALSIDKQAHEAEVINVKNALENGTYFQTVKDAYDKFSLDYESTEKIHLWGQEPTLTLNEFTKNFQNFYNLFPNLHEVFFSTNGVSGSDKIINYIKTISDIITHDFSIGIQVSYDGKENTQNQRGINPDVIIANINLILKELNNISLNPKLKVDFIFHYVINNITINEFGKKDYDKQKLHDYLYELSYLVEHFREINTNPQVTIGSFSPALLSPYNATQEEGKNLCNFYLNCCEIGKDIRFKHWESLTPMIYHRFLDLDYNTKGKDIILSMANHDLRNSPLLERFSNNTTCAPNFKTLKIRYDGTLLHCQSAIKGLSLDEIKDKTGLTWESQKNRIIGGYHPNIYKSTDEELKKFFYYNYCSITEIYPIIFSQILNMMTLLLNAHQIDESYYDKEKLLRHAYYLSTNNGCPYNRIIETNSITGCTAGWIRFLCNGFLDIVEKEYFKERDNKNDCKCRR